MPTYHIHIEGQVQGVGFRPFTYQLAKQFGLFGWVNNDLDGVHVEFNADELQAEQFYLALIQNAPDLAVVTRSNLQEVEGQEFQNFQIIHSNKKGETNLLLTPDFGLCKECEADIKGTSDRRYNYAFTTCINCGPRYSIIKHLPYDRENTAMHVFQMCPTCQNEYHTPADRRYFSQTNSCPNCSIQMSWISANATLSQKEIIEKAANSILAGKILAIKGIGGYLLMCDATNVQAIQKLRNRKHRPSKPFAVMYPDLAILSGDVVLREKEKTALNSPSAPIVLLKILENPTSGIGLEEIAPGLQQLGIMLPYTPLFSLLLERIKKPVVATSGNVTNAPIIYEDEKARNELSSIADFLLSNNRKIIIPQDDSVVRYTQQKQIKIILRRSRGYAPTYLNAKLNYPAHTILSMGAMLKSSFCLLHQKNTYISQYLGDLESFDTQQNFQYTLEHFFQLFKAKPDLILVDQHPEYHSSQLGKELAQKLKIPTKLIQHHKAHFAAILGEHNLLDSTEPTLGVIWDGTGLGDDNMIWGGEFFKYNNHQFSRLGHVDYFDFILRDKMPREPRISALCASWGINGVEKWLKDKFTKQEWNIYQKLLEKEGGLKTSSMGRLFDAVASLLGLKDKTTYEGEAAMQLEALAKDYLKTHKWSTLDSYVQEEWPTYSVPTSLLIHKIIQDLENGVNRGRIATKFHYSLVSCIANAARREGIKKIAFSGGVFQNETLVDLIQENLETHFELHFHKELSPNDENISFGQLIYWMIQQRSNQNTCSDEVFKRIPQS